MKKRSVCGLIPWGERRLESQQKSGQGGKGGAKLATPTGLVPFLTPALACLFPADFRLMQSGAYGARQRVGGCLERGLYISFWPPDTLRRFPAFCRI